MQYKSEKWVDATARLPGVGPVEVVGLLASSLPGSVAARPPEGGPADTGDLLDSSLPLNIDRPARKPDSPLKTLYTK